MVVVSATVTGRLIDRCGVGFAAASGAIQQKLAAANPEQVNDIRRVLDGIAAGPELRHSP